MNETLRRRGYQLHYRHLEQAQPLHLARGRFLYLLQGRLSAAVNGKKRSLTEKKLHDLAPLLAAGPIDCTPTSRAAVAVVLDSEWPLFVDLLDAGPHDLRIAGVPLQLAVLDGAAVLNGQARIDRHQPVRLLPGQYAELQVEPGAVCVLLALEDQPQPVEVQP